MDERSTVESLAQALINGVLLAALYAIVALGLTLIFGVLDVINFSHGQLVTLGAYLTYELVTSHLSFYAAVPMVMVGLAVVGLGMNVLTFRPVRSVPINGLLVSIGWVAIFSNIFAQIWGPDHYSMESPLTGSFRMGEVVVSRSQSLVMVAAVAVMVTLAVILQKTQPGRAMRATAQNREAALLMGIHVHRVDAIAFAAGAALAALAGALIANLFPVDPGLGESYMVYAFIALIIGGAGSAVGSVAGSLVVGVAVAMGQTYGTTAVANVAPFAVLILVLLVRPSGLVRTGYEATL